MIRIESSTAQNYDLRGINREEIMSVGEATRRLDACKDLVGLDLALDNRTVRCYLGDRILIQIQSMSVARVSGNKEEFERKLGEITTKTGVRFY